MKQLVLLDLYAGAGGCAKGYQQAGFYVIGIDHKPQGHYCGDEFYLGDVPKVLQGLIEGQWVAKPYRYESRQISLADIDVIHASPPCQAYSVTNHVMKANYPDLIEVTRDLLKQTGKPYVIENVVTAPLIMPTVLCGSMFGLGARGYKDGIWRQLRRHRLFESNIFIQRPECNHQGKATGVYGSGTSSVRAIIVNGKRIPRPGARRGGYQGSAEEQREAMGINWMNKSELSQAIPPAYTLYVGKRLIADLKREGCPKATFPYLYERT